MTEDRESVRVLGECIDLQKRKAQDYQNPNSRVRQADHYRRGIDTIHDMIHQKMLRAQSLIESGNTPNNESLEDTYKDMINYCSFAVAYLRGRIEGQDEEKDAFNRYYPKADKDYANLPIITPQTIFDELFDEEDGLKADSIASVASKIELLDNDHRTRSVKSC